MRNYIEFWWSTITVTYFRDGTGPLFSNTEYITGPNLDAAAETLAETKNEQLAQNQFLPPGDRWIFDATPPEPRYFLMNKENVLAILNPNQVIDGTLFTSESPRETWSHGK